MQYLLLIYENEKRFSKGYPEAELAEYRAFGKEFAAAIKGGNALQPTASAATVRVRDGKVLSTDGPFAETKEQLGGYYLVEANTRDEAVAMVTSVTTSATAGSGRQAGAGDPLLTSKITVPGVPEWLIPRPRIGELIAAWI